MPAPRGLLAGRSQREPACNEQPVFQSKGTVIYLSEAGLPRAWQLSLVNIHFSLPFMEMLLASDSWQGPFCSWRCRWPGWGGRDPLCRARGEGVGEGAPLICLLGRLQWVRGGRPSPGGARLGRGRDVTCLASAPQLQTGWSLGLSQCPWALPGCFPLQRAGARLRNVVLPTKAFFFPSSF